MGGGECEISNSKDLGGILNSNLRKCFGELRGIQEVGGKIFF